MKANDSPRFVDVSYKDLGKVALDPTRDCIVIRDVLNEGHCDYLVDFLTRFSKDNAPNQRLGGENWHYFVSSKGNSFDSFLFNNLKGLGDAKLTEAYGTLYKIYNVMGERTHYDNFELETGIDNVLEHRMINPLVFYYPAETSNFGWHKHDIRNQKFQLLCNLTQPGIDYTQGETWIYMADGKPDPDDPKLKEKCVVFGNNFEKGDVFSFPFQCWHKVLPTKKGESKTNARVSLLMPLAARSGEYKNEYLDT